MNDAGDLLNGGYFAADTWATSRPAAAALPPPAMAVSSPMANGTIHIGALPPAAVFGVDSLHHHRLPASASDGSVNASALVQHLQQQQHIHQSALHQHQHQASNGTTLSEQHTVHSLFAPSHFATIGVSQSIDRSISMSVELVSHFNLADDQIESYRPGILHSFVRVILPFDIVIISSLGEADKVLFSDVTGTLWRRPTRTVQYFGRCKQRMRNPIKNAQLGSLRYACAIAVTSTVI